MLVRSFLIPFRFWFLTTSHKPHDVALRVGTVCWSDLCLMALWHLQPFSLGPLNLGTLSVAYHVMLLAYGSARSLLFGLVSLLALPWVPCTCVCLDCSHINSAPFSHRPSNNLLVSLKNLSRKLQPVAFHGGYLNYQARDSRKGWFNQHSQRPHLYWL